jgi:hypothetical protein
MIATHEIAGLEQAQSGADLWLASDFVRFFTKGLALSTPESPRCSMRFPAEETQPIHAENRQDIVMRASLLGITAP